MAGYGQQGYAQGGAYGQQYPQQGGGGYPQGHVAVAMPAHAVKGVPPPAAPEGDYVGFMTAEVRKGFVEKVYAILAVQLLVTTSVVLLFMYVDSVQEWVIENPSSVTFAYVLSFATLIALACCPTVRRQYPMNFVTLAVFTLVESYLLGVIASFYTTESVLVALVATCAVTTALSAYAHTTTSDYTTSGAALSGGMMGLVVGFIFFLIWPTRLGAILLGVVACGLFAAFLVYDTQLILGGKHKMGIGPDEYIFGALSLYIDIVNMFQMVLCLTGRRDN